MNTEKIIVPEKQDLKEMLIYQPGSVVSKVLLKKNTGNITLFAFDKGEGLSEHTAPFDAFVQIIDGNAEVTISGNIYKLAAGNSIIMPADQPHSLKALAQFKMILVMIKS
jgi:quercetin dioxygenase-like cupin family protein